MLKFNKFLEEQKQLDEMHDRYMRSHGKKASGRGRWMFTTQRMGDVDHKDMYHHDKEDTVSKAAAAARKHFGTKDVYVMEEVELDEWLGGDAEVATVQRTIRTGGGRVIKTSDNSIEYETEGGSKRKIPVVNGKVRAADYSKLRRTIDDSVQYQYNEEVEQVDEGKLDKSSPIYKEYESLKKKSVSDLRNIVGRSHRVADLKGYDKAGAIRQILDDKYGEKKVDAFFGFSEEAELDEISKKTLGSYVKKAGASMASHGVAVGSGRNTEKSSRAMANRMKGMNRAADRLTKEEVELDEAQWGADNPYKKYKNDPERLRRMLKKNQDAAGNMRNRISKFMGSSPQGLKDELKDIENRIKQIKDVMREEVEIEEANKGTTPARYDMIKRAVEKLRGDGDSKAARRDAKRAMKSKDAQRGMAPVKTEARLDEISPKLARKAAAVSQAKNFEYGSSAYGPGADKEMDRLDKKADKAMAYIQKRQGVKGVRKVGRLANKAIYGKSRAFESTDLEEGRNETLKALEKLASSGGIDKADFQKAHDLYKANKLNDLRKHIYRLDTSPSEEIADVIHRHDSKAFNSMYPRAKSGDYIRKIVIDHGGK